MHAVCLTSNNYIHCVKPFAYLWDKFFGLPCLVAGYDVQPAELPPGFEFLSIGAQADYTWSAGVLRLLDLIPDEVFILVLEDYFLSEQVDVEAVASLAELIQRRADVAKIDLTDDRLKVGHVSYGRFRHVSLIRSVDDAPFQMSVQAAIWRKGFLRAYLDPEENAWRAEKIGTRRIVDARMQGLERRLILGARTPPMRYVNAIGGEGTMPGTWARHRFPTWMLEELEGMM